MRCVYKVPGKPAWIIEVENKLEALQQLVGGYIEVVHEETTLEEGWKLHWLTIINEEGRNLDMDPNIETAFGPALVGPGAHDGSGEGSHPLSV